MVRRYSSTLRTFLVFITILIIAVPLNLALAASNANVAGSTTSNSPIFHPVVTYDPGGYQATMVAAGDVNGDGRPDLVVIDCGGCYGPSGIGGASVVAIFLGNGDGTLRSAVTYASGGVTALFVAIVDLNADRKPDLVVVNRCGNNGCLNESLVSILMGNGDGSFQPPVNYGTGGLFPTSVVVTDVNGDGRVDMAVANDCSDPNCDGSVGILLGNGDGTFQPVVTYLDGGNSALTITAADVNEDGKPDLLVGVAMQLCYPDSCTYIGGVSKMLGNGDGTFQPAVTYRSGGIGAVSIAMADVNGDGHLDLIVGNATCCTFSSSYGGVAVRLGNGNGTFKQPVIYGSRAGGHGSSVAVADVNGDGKPDIVSTQQCAAYSCFNQGVVEVRLGNGDGTFQAATTYGSGGYLTSSVAIADLNGDKAQDLVVASLCADDAGICQKASVGVLLNTGPDTTPPLITVIVTPNSLSPTGQMVPVTVSGKITDSGSGYKPGSAEYSAQDEYNLVHPSGHITLDSSGNYLFTVLLQASREQNDADGRRYNIRVSAKDNAGNPAAKWTRVIVPHGD